MSEKVAFRSCARWLDVVRLLTPKLTRRLLERSKTVTRLNEACKAQGQTELRTSGKT